MKNTRWTAREVTSQTGRVAVITGANSGIGFETARVLALAGASVVLACRDEQRGNDALERLRAEGRGVEVETFPLNLADLVSVRRFVQLFSKRYDRLDLLINNAGVMIPPHGTTADGFETQIGVNHLGHFALTGLLLEPLLSTNDSRVVVVASQAHRWGAIDFDDLHAEGKRYDKWKMYGQSKLANLLFAYELQRRFAAAGTGTIATVAHPGWTKSSLSRHSTPVRWLSGLVAMNPAQGALPTLRAAVDVDLKGGEYFGPDGFKEMRGYPHLVSSSDESHDVDVASRLFAVSEEMTSVRYDRLAPS